MAAGSTPTTLCPQNFDEITKWVMQQFTKEDLEIATEKFIPELLESLHAQKRAAEVLLQQTRDELSGALGTASSSSEELLQLRRVAERGLGLHGGGWVA